MRRAAPIGGVHGNQVAQALVSIGAAIAAKDKQRACMLHHAVAPAHQAHQL